MAYNIYQGDDLIATTEKKTHTVEGLTPNTSYTFSVSEIIDDNESEKSDPVTVKTKYSDVSSVTISPKTNNLETGATRQLNVTIEPSTAKQDATYSSSDEGVATVNGDGFVTAIAEGEATITVTVDDKTDTATVSVTEPPEITTEEVTEEIDIVEYDTVRNDTEELPKGEEQVVQEGKNGYTEVTYKVTYEDGAEVDREEIDRETIDPVDEIINVGTYEEPEPDPEEGD